MGGLRTSILRPNFWANFRRITELLAPVSARAVSLWTDTWDDPGTSLLNNNSTMGLVDFLIFDVTWHISGLAELFE